MNQQAIPIACDMDAFTPEQRQRYDEVSSHLRQATEEVIELPDGYAFRYRTDETTWLKAAEYVDLERRCCPFFAFALELEPESGAVWLKLTGREGSQGVFDRPDEMSLSGSEYIEDQQRLACEGYPLSVRGVISTKGR